MSDGKIQADAVVVLAGGAGSRAVVPILDALGYTTRVVDDAFAAVCQILAQRVDLVIGSVDHADALPLLGLLRRHPMTESVPVVYLDPGGSVDRRVDLFRAGADDVLPVGLEAEELGVRLQHHLRARAATHQARAEVESTRQVVDALDEAILLIREDGRIGYANRAARRLLDLNPDVLRLLSLPQILGAIGVGEDVVPGLLHGPTGTSRQVEVAVGNRALHLRMRVESGTDGGPAQATRILRIEDLSRAREHEHDLYRVHATVADGIRHPLRLADGHLAHLVSHPLELSARVTASRAQLAVAQQVLDDYLDLAPAELGRPRTRLRVPPTVDHRVAENRSGVVTQPS